MFEPNMSPGEKIELHDGPCAKSSSDTLPPIFSVLGPCHRLTVFSHRPGGLHRSDKAAAKQAFAAEYPTVHQRSAPAERALGRRPDVLTVHRYPLRSLLSDGLRAVVGMAATFGPIVFSDMAPILALLFGFLGIIFFLFACQVALQALLSIHVSGEGIAFRGPIEKTLDWQELSTLRLAHYGARRRGGDGWYRLTLRGGNIVLKLDSTIENFDTIMTSVLRAASTADATMDATTRDNLTALGHDVD